MLASVSAAPRSRHVLLTPGGAPYLLVPLIPVAIALDIAGAGPTALFVTSALGVIPTAALMGRATEELASRAGPGIGGLLNVTFGNAPELIIALFALNKGLHEVVKASLVGSVIGNILLVMGAAMFAGGLGRDRQRFNPVAASAQASMLLLAIVAAVMPAVLALVSGAGLPPSGASRVSFSHDLQVLSVITAVVLIAVYASGLVFSLVTHRDLFNPTSEDDVGGEPWSTRRSVAMLALAGAAVAVMSEILVGSISEFADSAGVSQFFIGAVIVAIVGNAAEHWVAVLVARKDQMDLAVNIAIGSSAQLALFVLPVLVLASLVIGPGPLALVFNGFELAALVLAALIANQVTQDGESTWFEGLQLLAVYVIVAVAFFVA